jgi:hypothetical protein
MDKLFLVAQIASFVVAGAVVALNGIAPLTKTDKDDKALGVLNFIHDKVLSFILPLVAQRLAKAEAPAPADEPKAEVK